MIHVGALPGTPDAQASVTQLTADALREAHLYQANDVDGLMLENMHDVPYLRGNVGPEIVAALAIIAHSVKAECHRPVGLQILAAANQEALAVAHAAGLDFIRTEGYAFAHVADEGLIEACAGPLLRYRRHIGAGRVQIWADVKKKHSSHAVTADLSLGATAEAVEFMRADAVIVTGGATGTPPAWEDVREAKKHCGLPVVLGSGVDAENIKGFFPLADGFIVGSHFKREGHWRNAVDAGRVARFMDTVARLRVG
jgi:membrane complex biogenesis BtpA family protein